MPAPSKRRLMKDPDQPTSSETTDGPMPNIWMEVRTQEDARADLPFEISVSSQTIRLRRGRNGARRMCGRTELRNAGVSKPLIGILNPLTDIYDSRGRKTPRISEIRVHSRGAPLLGTE